MVPGKSVLTVLSTIGALTTAAVVAASAQALDPGFKSSLLARPADWNGDLFSANYSFPATANDLSSQPWMTLDPRVAGERDAYFAAVLAYGLASFTADIKSGCVKAGPDWFHAPWLTFSLGNTAAELQQGQIGSGREPICGMTQERSAPVGFLHANQTRQVPTWAVGTFNQPGGALLGRIWRTPGQIDLSQTTFPKGTFVVKFLFTAATTTEVPYLLGAPEWHANIYDPPSSNTNRKTLPVRLIQIDFGIRDPRFDSTTGWVYGTFMYHNDTGAAPADWKQKLLPVGVMWGNDPGKKADYKEQVLSPAIAQLRDQGKVFDLTKRKTFGWFDRVNGPLDNPISSCLSCHSTAQVHKTQIIRQIITPALISGQATDENKMLWFRDVPPGGTFTFTPEQLALVRQDGSDDVRARWTTALMADFVSTDTSLQLRMAIENARFFELQNAVLRLSEAETRLGTPIFAAGARERLLEAFRREASRIERAGEPE